MAAANRSGKTFEQVVSDLLRFKGVCFEEQCSLGLLSVFGKRVKFDFLIRPCVRFPNGLIIEAKWQDVTGSAEEKLPYLVMNIRTCYPYPTMIVLDGSGWSAGSLIWLNEQIDDKLIAVKSSGEFISWCNRDI